MLACRGHLAREQSVGVKGPCRGHHAQRYVPPIAHQRLPMQRAPSPAVHSFLEDRVRCAHYREGLLPVRAPKVVDKMGHDAHLKDSRAGDDFLNAHHCELRPYGVARDTVELFNVFLGVSIKERRARECGAKSRDGLEP